MSDPVTNADIEDVLAQVRRLVLQGAPAEPARPVRPTLLRSPAEPRPEPRGRLVLTPALRVEEAPEAGEEPARPLRALQPPEPVPARAMPPSPPTLLLSSPLVRPKPEPAEARIEAVPPSREAMGHRSDGTGAGTDWSIDWTLSEDLEEEPQDAIEGAAPLVFRHRALPFGDQGTAMPGPASAGTPRPGEDAPPALDEDRLRAIVLEVVRAELQGELGERITRNLRRLVRREVFRVLESREEP